MSDGISMVLDQEVEHCNVLIPVSYGDGIIWKLPVTPLLRRMRMAVWSFTTPELRQQQQDAGKSEETEQSLFNHLICIQRYRC